jgi:cardiolipin synthase (CMP-forming)
MFNLPNTLTMGRFFMIPIYFLVFFSNLEWNKQLAFFVLLLAGLTDIVDGYVARKYNMVTQMGIMLDPLVDKMMMISVFSSFLISGMISWWAATTFFIRDIGMIIGSAIYHYQVKKFIPANYYGKSTTILLYLSFLFILFEFPIGQQFLWGVIFFSFLTSMSYIIITVKTNRFLLKKIQ